MTFDEAAGDLFEIVGKHHARPDIPIEAEDFFTDLVSSYSERDALRARLIELVPTMFRWLSEPPDWIQSPDWPWLSGKPAVFVGSLDAPRGTFHDDARFYVFWSPETGATSCVIQVG